MSRSFARLRTCPFQTFTDNLFKELLLCRRWDERLGEAAQAARKSIQYTSRPAIEGTLHPMEPSWFPQAGQKSDQIGNWPGCLAGGVNQLRSSFCKSVSDM